MKEPEIIKIKCPHCNEEIEYKTYASINSKTDPELKEMLLSGALFKYECPHCHQSGFLGFPFLYHDPINHILIQYTSKDKMDETLSSFVNNVNKARQILGNEFNKYRYRICDDFGGLVEKIDCFEKGLDDRVLEITKILVGLILEKRNQITDDDKLFLYKVNDGLRADIVNQNSKTMKQIRIREEIYNATQKTYEPYFDEKKTRYAIINEDWAATLLNRINKEKQA